MTNETVPHPNQPEIQATPLAPDLNRVDKAFIDQLKADQRFAYEAAAEARRDGSPVDDGQLFAVKDAIQIVSGYISGGAEAYRKRGHEISGLKDYIDVVLEERKVKVQQSGIEHEQATADDKRAEWADWNAEDKEKVSSAERLLDIYDKVRRDDATLRLVEVGISGKQVAIEGADIPSSIDTAPQYLFPKRPELPTLEDISPLSVGVTVANTLSRKIKQAKDGAVNPSLTNDQRELAAKEKVRLRGVYNIVDAYLDALNEVPDPETPPSFYDWSQREIVRKARAGTPSHEQKEFEQQLAAAGSLLGSELDKRTVRNNAAEDRHARNMERYLAGAYVSGPMQMIASTGHPAVMRETA